MKIHTDTLTGMDVDLAARDVFVDYMPVGSQSRDHGFNVTLSTDHGTRRRNSQAEATGEYAATWDEWGIFIGRLFVTDPNAIVGQYNGANDYHWQTGHRFNGFPFAECPSHKWQPPGGDYQYKGELQADGTTVCESECKKGCGAIKRWRLTRNATGQLVYAR